MPGERFRENPEVRNYELELMKQISQDLALAENWLLADFRDQHYKKMIDARKDLEEYPTLMSHYQKLVKVSSYVIRALSLNPVLKRLSGYNLSTIPAFSNYCRHRGINLQDFNLAPLKKGQRTFSLPLYLEKLSHAQIIIFHCIKFVAAKNKPAQAQDVPQSLSLLTLNT